MSASLISTWLVVFKPSLSSEHIPGQPVGWRTHRYISSLVLRSEEKVTGEHEPLNSRTPQKLPSQGQALSLLVTTARKESWQ